MFAIFETGGKQYRAEKGIVLEIESLPEESGKNITFERIFLIADDKATHIGMPFVEGAKITGKVLEHGLDDKVRVQKFQAKKRHKTLRGHRQKFTRVEITAVTLASAKKVDSAVVTGSSDQEPKDAAPKKTTIAKKITE